MKKIIIREPISQDVDALVSLMGQLGYPISFREMEKNLLEYSTRPNQKAWIAEKDKKAIGCIAVAVTNYFHRKGTFLRVITLVVDRDHRREGIGRELMKKAESYAKDLGCSHVELTSGMHRAKLGYHDFYRSLGFSDLGEIKKHFGKKLAAEEF
jgi:ribosomal protein S18 acetylase RimI-like enzyme